MQDQTLISILGSGNLATALPEDLDSMFADGILINRNPARFGHPHEMGGYSAYLALKALELRALAGDAPVPNKPSLHHAEKQKILRAILARLKKSEGFWQHSHLSVGGTANHGLRTTAAGIKLLAVAYIDGLFDDKKLIVTLLKKQLSFHEKLEGGGTWFFHDSVEGTVGNKKKGKFLNIGNAFGTSDYNAVVLNTHVETLNTLMLVMDLLEIKDELLLDYLKEGSLALQRVLGNDYRRSFKYKLFQAVETPMRRRYLGKLNGTKTFFNRIFNVYFWTYRDKSLSTMPGFQHEDGYLERALYYKSTTYDYHMVNLLDLLRFAKLYKKTQGELSWNDHLQATIKKGMDYAFSPAYSRYTAYFSKKSTCAIRLCEAIVIFWIAGKLVEKKWVDNYLKVRRLVPPSPAILGYDPAIVTSIEEADAMTASNYLTEKIDLFILKNKEILLVNHSNEAVQLVLDKRFKQQLLGGGQPAAAIPPQAAVQLIPVT